MTTKEHTLLQLPPLGRIGVGSILVFYCLAGHTLRKVVKMVFEAVDRSIEEGRKQVGRIVGRDTSNLDAQEICTAALETLAENLSEGCHRATVLVPPPWHPGNADIDDHRARYGQNRYRHSMTGCTECPCSLICRRRAVAKEFRD